ncbi:hypothetical protein VCHA49P379_20350 [Vibrio chagasii]|nr:hypothetical protein VCHA49P379_20350 [Vibrio chagasii]CAH7243221.1 hypothetical protein VCHA53O464_10270 [Vibrio chagasii]
MAGIEQNIALATKTLLIICIFTLVIHLPAIVAEFLISQTISILSTAKWVKHCARISFPL